MRWPLLVLLCGALVAACGGDDTGTPAPSPTRSGGQSHGKIRGNPANAKVRLTIGSKNFTEQKVLGEIYAQGLQAAGYTVKKDLDLGDEKRALAALKSGEISAYPEYTGTALLSFFGRKAEELRRIRRRPTRRPSASSRPKVSLRSRRRRSPPPTRSP